MEIKLVCSKPPHHPWSVNTSRSFHFFSIKSMTQQIGPDREYLIKHLGIETSKVGKTFKNQGVFMSFGIEKKTMGNNGQNDMHFKTIHMSNPKNGSNDGTSGRILHVSRWKRLQCFDTWWIQCFIHLANDIPGRFGAQQKCGLQPLGGKCVKWLHSHDFLTAGFATSSKPSIYVVKTKFS